MKLERKYPRPVRNAVAEGQGQPKAQGKRLWALRAGARTLLTGRKTPTASS